jgi:hypothetical protein
MPNVEHNSLTASELHEPKGADTAEDGQFYMFDGAGSGDLYYVPLGWGFYRTLPETER